MSRPPLTDELTARELQVAALAAAGRSNIEIGKALFLSPMTIKSHLKGAFRKVKVRDRAELVATLLRTGLLTFDAAGTPVAANVPPVPGVRAWTNKTPFISVARGLSGLEATAVALTRAGSPPEVWQHVQAALGEQLPAVEAVSV